ncbi:MAG: mercury methylation ferredoxin HgcB [Syntrophomonadaceae bacterium]|jgi:NAD-dependent dihydropyrimidine dehydrogenase PreA subunit|nr:mercury methylation ferredoxin HgcB [Syntrophomonadaceae bacterium]
MKHRYLRDVVTLQLDTERCTGCGMCMQVCPQAVFALEDGRARIADRDACLECGACARNCPVEAVSVSPGVGCAYALIVSALTGRATSCDCDGTCC